MKILSDAARWLFMLCLPLLLLTLSLGLEVNSQWLYENGFSKYDVSQTTGLADAELEKTADGIISYWNSSDEDISLEVVRDGVPFELFNQREVIHLRDVKGLIRLDYWLLLGTGLYVLTYTGISLLGRKRLWPPLVGAVLGGSGLTLALMLLLGLGILLDFDWLFLQFHLLSFSNDFWYLDPARDYLIMLFPSGFWYDATIFGATLTGGLAVVLGGAAVGYRLFKQRRTAT